MPMYKKQLFVLMIILLAAAGGTYYGLYSEEQAVVLDAAATAESSPPKQEITVYVTGAVNKPGLVNVPEGARAADAVNACGGLLPTADGEKINMAQSLKDGQQLKVPEKTGTNGKTDSGKETARQIREKRINPKEQTAGKRSISILPMKKRWISCRELARLWPNGLSSIGKAKGHSSPLKISKRFAVLARPNLPR